MPQALTAADSLALRAAAVEIRHLAVLGTIPGVIPRLAAARNGPGQGRLRCPTLGTIQYKAPGSATWGPSQDIFGDGDYLLPDGEDADAFLRATVVTAHLQAGREAQVHLADVYENNAAGPDVTAGQAAAGNVAQYQITIANQSANTVERLAAWLDAATADVEISTDGLAFSAPTSEAAALALGSLAAGATATLYCRRTIAPGASPDPSVLDLIHLAFDAL